MSKLQHNAEYAAYQNAKYRCTNPKSDAWSHYGGRGIRFLFTSFDQFLTELGPRPTPQHSLDRKDNDGPYAPGNVRWSTDSVQAANRRPFTDEHKLHIRIACKGRNTRPRSFDYVQAATMRAQGIPAVQIATRFAVSVAAVNRALRRLKAGAQ